MIIFYKGNKYEYHYIPRPLSALAIKILKIITEQGGEVGKDIILIALYQSYKGLYRRSEIDQTFRVLIRKKLIAKTEAGDETYVLKKKDEPFMLAV